MTQTQTQTLDQLIDAADGAIRRIDVYLDGVDSLSAYLTLARELGTAAGVLVAIADGLRTLRDTR